MSDSYYKNFLRRVRSTRTKTLTLTESFEKRGENYSMELSHDYRANITMFSYKRQDSCSSFPEGLDDVKPPSRENSTDEAQSQPDNRQRSDKPAGLLNRFKSRTFLRQISRSSPDLTKDPTVPARQPNLGFSASLSGSTKMLSAHHSLGRDVFLATPLSIHLRAESAPEIPAALDTWWKEPSARCFHLKLISQAKAQVCVLNHPRNVLGKILSSKYLRRWETHQVILTDESISSQTPIGHLEKPFHYATMEAVQYISGWDSYCLRVTIPLGSLVIQMSTSQLRDQFYFSLLWKKSLSHFKSVISSPSLSTDILLKETKDFIGFITRVPLQDATLFEAPFQILSSTFQGKLQQDTVEELFTILSPLLEKRFPPQSTFSAISRHFELYPESSVLGGIIASLVHRVLKHSADFRDAPYMRYFVLDYLLTLSRKGEENDEISEFLASLHGTGSTCPHPRVLPNLVSVCLEGVASFYKTKTTQDSRSSSCESGTPTICVTLDTSTNGAVAAVDNVELLDEVEDSRTLKCCLEVFQIISKYDDWRSKLAPLLGSVPFPKAAVLDSAFLRQMFPVIESVGTDPRCEVHKCVLDSRCSMHSWFHLVSPISSSCPDDGTLWASVLETVLNCCCRRRKFMESLINYFQPIQILALRNNHTAQEALYLMLQWDLLSQSDPGGDCSYWLAIKALHSTETGKKLYEGLLEKQTQLRKLQKEGGPRILSLPSNTTDEDVAKLFSTGSFGSLETLNLSFTRVTSACAEHLIQLPSLKSLNLWSTQFGDKGLQLVSEHLCQLEVLNLCETPVTDMGLTAISNLKKLKVLNLNSTRVSLSGVEELKKELPSLIEVDLKYTDVW